MSEDQAVDRPAHEEEEPEKLNPVLTRREFLVGAGAGAAAAAVAAAGVAVVTKPGKTVAPATGLPAVAGQPSSGAAPPLAVAATGPVSAKMLTLNVNGQTYQVAVQARATLADVLRHQLGLTGTKIGCNRSECGSCTVVMGGKSVYSCTQMAFASEGKEITTVEGLAKDTSSFEGLHPIQQGFIIKDAPQCAFCMSGQMMSAFALLKTTPQPTEVQIKQGLSGNICRCGNYNHLWDAVLWAAERMRGGA